MDLKKILYKNAKQTIENFADSHINNIDENLKNKNLERIAKLFEENNSVNAIFPSFDLEVLKDTNSRPTRDKYHFPDVLNIGELISKTDINLPYIDKSSYILKSDCFIPMKDSGVCILENPRYKDRITEVLEMITLKLIASLPDGLAKVTIIDKAGSGQNFPRLNSLHEKFTDGKVLTDEFQIEKEIEDIKSSMTAISQSISHSGFETIEEYNLNTNEVQQRYNFIVINNFPSGFSKKSAENLLSLIESGEKAGIYVMLSLSYNPSLGFNQELGGISMSKIMDSMTTFEFSDRPHNFLAEKLISENIELLRTPLKAELEDKMKNAYNGKYKIKIPHTKTIMREAVKILNDYIQDMDLRPIVEIEKAYPSKNDFWKKEASKGVCIPFGKKGIQNVYLALGVNQYDEDSPTHHALIGGSTGSGKTVLLNDLILLGSMLYSPEELQFFLLDYKEGTEFAVYKDFPHVNILAMESEIEFGHDVLSRALKMIQERGALFKKTGSENLYEHNKKVNKKDRLPAIVIIIDEFQVLFPKDKKITSKSNELINDILRRGRSFGIRLILATQTLNGVDIESQILSNIPIRVALKMEPQDAAKILTQENIQGQHLSNAMPGEGIYNPSFGAPAFNTHFQAFKAIGPSIENSIKIVKEHLIKKYSEEELKAIYKSRFVYNGEEEGRFEDLPSKKDGHFYIGEPSGLNKEHISITYERDYAENLIIVGDSKEKAFSIFTHLALQGLEQNKEIMFFNFISNKAEDFKRVFGNNIKLINNMTAEKELYNLYEIFKQRKTEEASDNKKDIMAFLFYIESSKLYTNEKEANILSELAKDGPEVGIFLNVYISDYQNLEDAGILKDLSKFKKRIALKGGDSLKLLGNNPGISFSTSDKVSIISSPTTGEDPVKFKPYRSM